MAIVEASVTNFAGQTFIGNGTDTLKLMGDGVFWFTKATVRGFTDIVIDGRANIVIDATQLAGISGFSASSFDYASIYITGQTIDLRNTVFAENLISITIDSDNATVTARNARQALKISSYSAQNDTIVVRETLTIEDRAKLHKNGFDVVKDGSGAWTNIKPLINGLDGQTIIVAKGQSALIDPQGDAAIVDDDTAISKLQIQVLETNIYPLAELEFGANFRVDGASWGSSIYYQGIRIGGINSIADGFEMVFYPNISHAVAHEFIRTLAYKPDDYNIADHEAAIKITAIDPGGRSSTATINLDIKNHINTSSGNYIQQGTSLKDRIYGSSDNEIFFPGKGADVVLTGAGKDIIVFDTTPSRGNRDHITDFSVKHDTLWLDNAVFKKLGKKGSELKPSKLDKNFFTIGEAAKDKNDYIYYNKITGILYYDKDGSGSGKSVEISQFDKKLKFSYNDIYVI